MPRTLSDVELEIIENGEDDWVLLAHVMGIVAEASQQPLNDSEALESASSVCLELCASGFAQLGRYTDQEHFVPWPERGAELQERLGNELRTPPPGIDIELNRMRIMLDILPEGLAAWKRQT
ncbi:hypothetical protein [Glutamicibacter sp. FBE19]|uniref:hypothetical protein n=1 Tax=Glutamicibacter sp. FBE19 TaxID=2761534 RepID=UPI00189684DA|nr:hypothetical protein [Glutamicibacter sp. FBE19]MBF6672463.1 hypothetical protein [Glutamicibacter sp. FBE19]